MARASTSWASSAATSRTRSRGSAQPARAWTTRNPTSPGSTPERPTVSSWSSATAKRTTDHRSRSPHLGAELGVEVGKDVEHRVDGAGAGLKDGGGVERRPAETHLLKCGHASDNAIVLGIEALALRIARRRRHHALKPDGGGFAPGLDRVGVDALDPAPRLALVPHATAEPSVAESADPPVCGFRVAADPDR